MWSWFLEWRGKHLAWGNARLTWWLEVRWSVAVSLMVPKLFVQFVHVTFSQVTIPPLPKSRKLCSSKDQWFSWSESVQNQAQASPGSVRSQAAGDSGSGTFAVKRCSGWWFGCHQFGIFPEILGISSSQLTFSDFSEGWPNHQPVFFWRWDWFMGLVIVTVLALRMALVSFFCHHQPLSLADVVIVAFNMDRCTYLRWKSCLIKSHKSFDMRQSLDNKNEVSLIRRKLLLGPSLVWLLCKQEIHDVTTALDLNIWLSPKNIRNWNPNLRSLHIDSQCFQWTANKHCG